MAAKRIQIKDVDHIRIAGGPDLFCAWPVMGGLHDFGNGEITVTFVQGESAYRTASDVAHYEEEWAWANTLFWDPFNETSASYPNLRRLPSGRIACTLGFWKPPISRFRWMGIIYSEDEGINWTPVRRIGWWGVTLYPLVLRDGRLLLIYAWRQSRPYGIRGMLSEDEGRTWSPEFIIRDDAASPDLGYPVATERPDGRIFTAYYYNVDEKPFFRGGPRHIAGSIFRLD